tara:strand:- start:136 stop:339 length:204 start_codon:yes stop_codon:yes gene_type:complete
MSPNLLRGTLFCSSFSLAFYALVALIWSVEVAVAIAVPAALLWLAGGFVARVDDEVGYPETVYGEES